MGLVSDQSRFPHLLSFRENKVSAALTGYL